jgi:hypothetical protein
MPMNRWLLVAAAVFPIVALCQDPPIPLRYDYVGANLAVPDLDELGVDLEGSTTVARELIVFGRYLNYEPRNRYDIATLQIGVGKVWNIRRNIDFIASLSYATNEIDTPARQGFENEGVIVGAQLRGWATNRIELSGAAMLDHSKSSSTDTVVELGVQYLTKPQLSYGGRIRVDEDDTTVSGGLRFYFGASRQPLPR